MREYGLVHTCFWSNPDMQDLSSEAKLLALYLLTGPHTNMLGCSKTPHNLGHNNRGERYDGLHVIFKNADNIERFIRNCHNPPQLTVSAQENKSLALTIK